MSSKSPLSINEPLYLQSPLSINDPLYLQILDLKTYKKNIPLILYKYIFYNRTEIKKNKELTDIISKYGELNELIRIKEDYKQNQFYLQNYIMNNYINNMKVLLDDGYCHWGETLYYYAIHGKNIACLKFLIDNYCPWRTCTIFRRVYGNIYTFIFLNIADIAAHCGKLEYLKFLYNEGYTIDKNTLYAALDGLHREYYHSKKQFKRFKKNILACIKFLYDVGCEHNFMDVYLLILQNNSLMALKYWHSIDHPWEDKEKQMRYLVCEAIKNGELPLLIYLHEETKYKYLPIEIEHTLQSSLITKPIIKYIYFNLIDLNKIEEGMYSIMLNLIKKV